jgi:hypothetical protein
MPDKRLVPLLDRNGKLNQEIGSLIEDRDRGFGRNKLGGRGEKGKR